jgi:hypothetical protein
MVHLMSAQISPNIGDKLLDHQKHVDIPVSHTELTKSDILIGNVEVSPPSLQKDTVSDTDEPLLRENPQRLVLFPIQYHKVRLI